MTTQTTQQITKEAIQRVIDNNQPFSKIYYDFAENWVKSRFCSFTSDDLRFAFLKAGNEPPREPRAYGGAINTLASKGFIFDTGATIPSKRKECHNRPLKVWISAVFKAKQSNNRKQDITLDMFQNL